MRDNELHWPDERREGDDRADVVAALVLAAIFVCACIAWVAYQ